MADGIVTRIEGLADLKIAIEALKSDLRKRVVRGALRDAARPMVRQARTDAPVLKSTAKYRTPGLLKRSIKIFGSKRQNGRDGTIGIYIAVRGNKKLIAAGGKGWKNPNDPFYWWWQEFGFTAVGRKKIGGGARHREGRIAERVRGGTARKIPGKKFMTNAFESMKGAAVEIFEQRIAHHIEKANRRK